MAPRVEERVSYLEAKMEEVGKALVEVKSAIAALDQKLDHRVDTLDAKVDRVIAFQVATLLALVGWIITTVLKS